MPKYLIFLVQQHFSFRRPELESLCDLFNIKISNLDDIDKNLENPFFIVNDIPNDTVARKLLSRSILCKGIYELYECAEDGSYDTLHKQLSNNKTLHLQIQNNNENKDNSSVNTDFKFDFEFFGGNRKYSAKQKIEIINTFQHLDIKTNINLKTPGTTYTLIEHYLPLTGQTSSPTPHKVYFTRLVSLSRRTGQNVLDKYDLAKRPFRGTTSFEAELSLVTCNIAQINHGKLLYDPFVGTGSFLCAAAEFGALCFGSDIDGRMIRGHTHRTPSNAKPNSSERSLNGKTKKSNDTSKYQTNGIKTNFLYYGYPDQLLDVVTMDFTHNSLRNSLKLDTIICDPPYGIREGIKVLGAKDPAKHERIQTVLRNGQPAYLHRDYIPTKKPYSLDLLLQDILEFASQRLDLGGRLCFWMPVANSNDIETVVPLHSNLELKYSCVQEFNKWSRRLLCYVNRGESYNGPTNDISDGSARNEFRKDYFNGFN
ncbi:hypothetical protein ACO0RG_000636 [Hanseniaspora osmophila]|uniref:tRNA (guanine(10)-N(2))-methyltransferase n=1 Tax=Hanseniaspora osmophila TaxID=56408 RepID=A0A1E5R2E6_9ASCO|nr:tRNA (guanine(10)-N2)-methyltransferase [Hanseniaspora osmophila]